MAIYAAADADDLARRKGVKNGFTDLIRPYGNRVMGKVVVRDSSGASRAWEDFGIRFIDLGRLAEDAATMATESPQDQLEELMENYIHRQTIPLADIVGGLNDVSGVYKVFLNRLLCSPTISPHEAFLHPVGAVMAISSSTPQPIETLRHLYQQTTQGSRALPSYVNAEYLRYYVLVHDEDRDDFGKSSALFDQMKRHFGLHCHLLRLRSTACTQSDDDTEELPKPEWLSPSEDLVDFQNNSDLIELNVPSSPYIFSTDAAALRVFVRELVTQSIIYHMEQRVALWNEQVASRRRGLSGRFMSLSKRWAGIGSSSRNSSSATNLVSSGASGNYDSIQASYRFDTPEALLRKLADYAFMLRDYKLAASTYELVRSDYMNDKAWKYLAGANEMCCVATLLNPLGSSVSSKMKMENFDQMVETATYSYLTRCTAPGLALRAILLAVELLKVRGRVATDTAAKWAVRSLELGLVGSVGHVLISERTASCFAARIGIGNTGWGTRKRKAALWCTMAADEWMKLGRAELAAERLDDAQELYSEVKNGRESPKAFKEMADYVEQLRLAVRIKLGQPRHRALSGASTLPRDVEDEDVEEMTPLEKLDSRVNRRSLIGTANPLDAAASLSPVKMNRPDPLSRDDDDFE